jgi:hypothetical protein
MTQFEQVPYGGWQTCYRATGADREIIVTGEVGPRIIRFGKVGGDNVFREAEHLMGRTDITKWVNYGGHRLWHAPEEKPRTYQPDNAPVTFEQHELFGRFIQPTEAGTGIQKVIDLSLNADTGDVIVVHRLHNHNLWDVELAVWGLSVMAPDGTAIIPLPPRGTHAENLQPSNTLTLWAYTDMADPRWTWGRKYTLLRQDGTRDAEPQKIGSPVPDGWAAYANGGQLFVKMFGHIPEAIYPDMGSAVEVFTNRVMLEVETLSPLLILPAGESVEHIERWHLFDDVVAPQNDADVDAHILPLVESLTR